MEKTFVCTICGYVHKGSDAPDQCPQCKAGKDKFKEQAANADMSWADERIAFEEAEHAAKFAEMLGEVVVADTKANLTARVAAEHGGCQGKKDLATMAKKLNYDAIHDTVHEMCKDEARHGMAFKGLLDRYFGK